MSEQSWVESERRLLGSDSGAVALMKEVGRTMAGIFTSPGLLFWGLFEAVKQGKWWLLPTIGSAVLAACGNAQGIETSSTPTDGVLLTPTPDSHGASDWPAQVRYTETNFDPGSAMSVLQDGELSLEAVQTDYPVGIETLEEAGFKVNEMDFYRLRVMDGDAGDKDDIEYVIGYDPATGKLMFGFELAGVNVHTPDAGEPLAEGERWEWVRAELKTLSDGAQSTTIFGGGFEVLRIESDDSWKIGVPFQTTDGRLVMVEPVTGGGGKLASPVQWMSELRSDTYKALQERIAGSEQFTLVGDRVEMQTKTAIVTLPRLSIDPMTGECRFTGDDGVVVGCLPESMAWGTGYFNVNLTNGLTAMFDGTSWTFEPVAGSTVAVADGTVTVDGTALPAPSVTPGETDAEPTVDSSAWIENADGKILSQSGELLLFNRDQFVVNPELAESLYKDVLLKFVYAVNRAGDVDGFAKTYPTYEMFARMVVENPGKTYDDLQLCAQHPDARGGTESAVYCQWLPAGEKISLSSFVVDLAEPGEDRADYVDIGGGYDLRMDVVEVDGQNRFRFTLTNRREGDRSDLNLTDLSSANDAVENLRTVTLGWNLLGELARRKASASLEEGSGLIMVGRDPDAMSLMVQASSTEQAARWYEQWANGEQYFLLAAGEEVSWEERLELYNASTLLSWIRQLVG